MLKGMYYVINFENSGPFLENVVNSGLSAEFILIRRDCTTGQALNHFLRVSRLVERTALFEGINSVASRKPRDP